MGAEIAIEEEKLAPIDGRGMWSEGGEGRTKRTYHIDMALPNMSPLVKLAKNKWILNCKL